LTKTPVAKVGKDVMRPELGEQQCGVARFRDDHGTTWELPAVDMRVTAKDSLSQIEIVKEVGRRLVHNVANSTSNSQFGGSS
jgi:hypothetical protein